MIYKFRKDFILELNKIQLMVLYEVLGSKSDMISKIRVKSVTIFYNTIFKSLQ